MAHSIVADYVEVASTRAFKFSNLRRSEGDLARQGPQNGSSHGQVAKELADGHVEHAGPER